MYEIGIGVEIVWRSFFVGPWPGTCGKQRAKKFRKLLLLSLVSVCSLATTRSFPQEYYQTIRSE